MKLQDRMFLASQYLQRTLQMYAPIDTGNLMLHGILPAEMLNPFVYEVIIGGGVVNYAVITNEMWEGRTNPNQGWVERAIEYALPMIKQIVFGQISIEDVNELLLSKAQDVQNKLNERAKALSERK
jgi:hypothetical protein